MLQLEFFLWVWRINIFATLLKRVILVISTFGERGVQQCSDYAMSLFGCGCYGEKDETDGKKGEWQLSSEGSA